MVHPTATLEEVWALFKETDRSSFKSRMSKYPSTRRPCIVCFLMTFITKIVE